MPVGNIITSSLDEALEVMVASARVAREAEGRASQLVERQTLENNTGLDWNEITLSQFGDPVAITETTVLDNPQMVELDKFPITPTMIGIQTFITDKVQARISSKVYARIGELAQNAMTRKRDKDVITVFDGASVTLCGAGITMASGYIAAAKSRILGNPTEPGNGEVVGCFHDYQLKDVADELKGGIGTYPVPDGITAKVFTDGFNGRIDGVGLFADNNIAIDANDDAKGAVFARNAIVLVQGTKIKKESKREPQIGGGGTSVFMYDEYGLGERSAGNWLYKVVSDATAPTA